MIWKNYSFKKVCVKLSELDYYTHITVITLSHTNKDWTTGALQNGYERNQ